MLVPEFWAESRARHRTRNRQITVRRFGWSETSQAEAQDMADRRVKEALDRLIAGESLPRHEPKVPYGGADGIPIREEAVLRSGPDVVTRNSYGALCLNTPDVLFVDIDYPTGPPLKLYLIYFAIVLGIPAIASAVTRPAPALVAASVLCLVFGAWICGRIHGAYVALRGGRQAIVRQRVERFLESHPDWHARLYLTPAGMRLLAMHRTFSTDDPEVAECFDALGADRQYARMCKFQKCFRARVSPKPWRIGISSHIRPARGTWPVPHEVMPQRGDWIRQYETRAEGFAACRFLEGLGSMVTTSRTLTVARLHDEMSRALTDRPIA